MATAQQLINVERSQLGYVEGGGPDGRSGNITKYWAELDPAFQGASWCACFQRWSCKHSGAPMLPISAPYYCPSYVIYAKQHGLWDSSGHYSPGDLVFFDWAGNGVAEHIGLVVADNGSIITTIEGNTSPEGAAGSQSNGGGVYLRHRLHGSTVLGVLKLSKLLTKTVGPIPIKKQQVPPRNPVKTNPFAAPKGDLGMGCKTDKQTGLTQVHWVQWAIGVPTDGVWGNQTDHAVRLFQQVHKLGVDGVVGPLTRAALAKITH